MEFDGVPVGALGRLFFRNIKVLKLCYVLLITTVAKHLQQQSSGSFRI